MDTLVTFNKKTGEMTIDVLDGVGTQCQEQNGRVYERLKKELGLPDSAIKEIEKPEMYETQAEEQGERIDN